MKVFYLVNDLGEVYGNARYFTSTGVPKLYGTHDRAQNVIDVAQHMQRYRPRTLWYGAALAHVVEDRL